MSQSSIQCAVCGITVVVRGQYADGRRTRKYCGKACSAVGRKGQTRSFKLRPKCPPGCECGKHQRFKGRPQYSFQCEYCGKDKIIVSPCYAPGGTRPRKYCSCACRAAAQRAKSIAAGRITKTHMSSEEFESRLASQNGCCAICLKPISGSKVHRDHCHATGAWRGLLCGKCNSALGLFEDDLDNLLRAWQYLLTGGVPLAPQTV